MKKCDRLYVCVDISRVQDQILNNKKSIQRYKDYILKRLVKKYIKEQIKKGAIDPNEDIKIVLNIDNQSVATNGVYNLRESIYEELKEGITNFNYGHTFNPILYGDLMVETNYCDSEKDYLVQAADIYANRIWTSFVKEEIKLRQSSRCCWLTLP